MIPSANILIPVKGLKTGKTRLSRALSDEDRYKLNSLLAERTIRIVASAAVDMDLYVVSPDQNVRDIAVAHAADFLIQKSDGLNAGLQWAAEQLPDRRTIFVAADLPELEPDDIRILIAETGIGICPDQRRQGTNAISVPTPCAIPFRFGANSFDAHCAQARATNFSLRVIDRPGIAFDLDTESDLSRMKGWPRSINPRSVRR